MKVAIGQDSHRFDFKNKEKKLILGGIVFENHPSLEGNSDSDVILHSITNAISGVTCKNVLGEVSDNLCKSGIIDSKAYLQEALKDLKFRILHLSISIECKTPKISPRLEELRDSISNILGISRDSIGITATSGEELTEFGKGNGIQVFSIITVG